MTSFIERLNALAASWGQWMTSSALQSALVLSVLLLIWPLLRKRVSAHLAYALFLLPMLPLALPSIWTVAVETDAMPAWTQMLPQVGVGNSSAENSSAEGGSVFGLLSYPDANDEPSAAQSTPSPEALASANITPSFGAWLLLGWTAICATLLVAFVIAQIQTAQQIRFAPALPREDKRRVKAILRELGSKTKFDLRIHPQLTSPALWGIFRPRILFPPQLIGQLNHHQLAWVVGHELAHHQRFDLVMAAAQRLIQIVWFFNPLVWWQNHRLDHLRECACDESAQAKTQIHGQQCAEALLQVAALPAIPCNRAFVLQTLHHHKQNMKQRILRLMNKARPSRPGMTPLAIPVLIFAAGLSATTFSFQASSQATNQAQNHIAKAQTWLIQQQNSDGSWSAGPNWNKPAGEFTNVGVTGLVLLSLHDANAEKVGKSRTEAIQKGLEFLRKPLMDPVGYYKPRPGFEALASHAIAANAWLTINPQVTNKEWKATASRAIQILTQAQCPYSGWGFAFEPNGDVNSFNTSLALQTMAKARDLGFDIPRYVNEGGKVVFQSLRDKSNGRVGYSHGQSKDVRIIAKKKSHPAELTELCTAMTLVAQADWGAEVIDDKDMTQSLLLVSSKRPAWNAENSNVDYYYWYYGAKAMNLAGGAFAEKWRENLHKVLFPRQLENGSFPAVDAWSPAKATVHATAMATLALRATK
ncbi:MAG: hypothetical protein H8E15_06485 [Planctomycetes bacterium]|nr:hypothetical protein [Planctomycetota bacterium]